MTSTDLAFRSRTDPIMGMFEMMLFRFCCWAFPWVMAVFRTSATFRRERFQLKSLAGANAQG